MHKIHVIYHENNDGTFDSYVEGSPHNIRAINSLDLCEARTFIRILFREEIGPCKIVQETIKYLEGI